jgi:DNA-binding beta-propeller fold protein YncE
MISLWSSSQTGLFQMRLFKKIILSTVFSALLVNILYSCSDNEEITPVDDQLELLAKYKIDVPEPSGLAIDQSGSALYTVSDNTNKVYKISAQGEVIRTFGYSGNDPCI